MDTSLIRQHRGLLGGLAALAMVAWYSLLAMGESSREGRMGASFGSDAVLFMTIWVVMMVAMMFPAAAPMVLTFAHLQSRRGSAGRTIRSAAFVLGYLAIWSATGLVAYGLAVAFDALMAASVELADLAPRLAGLLIIAAGIYQLTPLKRACLNACRSPLGFLMTEWREGTLGAFRIGLQHGVFCLGCCALLFAAIVPIGMMNVALMAFVATLVLAEKTAPQGKRVATLASLVLIAGGALVVIIPTLLPVPAAM